MVYLVSKVMPLVASFQVADGLAGSCGGVLRGQGAHKHANQAIISSIISIMQVDNILELSSTS